MIKIDKAFIDNEHYAEMGVAADAFVDAIYWLYTDEAFFTISEYKYVDYRIPNNVETPMFMTCVNHFVKLTNGKHPKHGILSEAKKMLSGSNEFDVLRRVEYTDDMFWGKSLVLANMEPAFVESVLWGAFIYFLINAHLNLEKNKNNKRAALLHDCLQSFTNENDQEFSRHFLMQHTIQTVKAGVKYYNDERAGAGKSDSEIVNIDSPCRAESNAGDSSGVTTDGSANDMHSDDLKQQIEQLTDELEWVKQENARLKTENGELEQRCRRLEQDSADIESVVLEPHAKVRIEYVAKMLEKSGADPEVHGNKSKMSTVIAYLLGNGKSSCKNYLSDRRLNRIEHGEEVKRINRLLSDIGADVEIEI